MDNNGANGSLINENIVEQPLSPVLNKKRYNRSVLHKSAKKQLTGSENKLMKSPEKRSSSIPVAISVFKSTAKKDVNCKEMKTGCEGVSGKSLSTSEAQISEYTNLVHNVNVRTESNAQAKLLKHDIKAKTESDPKIKHLKRDYKFGLSQPRILHHNCEYKHASGDISDESCNAEIKERSQFINGEDGSFNELNMLYENLEFIPTPHCSENTLTDLADSNEALLLRNFPNTSDGVNESQLNYNVATGESGSTLERDVKEIHEKPVADDVKNDYAIGTQETNMLFSNVSQFLRPELDHNVESLNTSKNMVNVNVTQSIFNTLPGVGAVKTEDCEKDLKFKFEKFYGFDKDNIAEEERRFAKYRTVLMTFNSEIKAMKKKVKANNLHEPESLAVEAIEKDNSGEVDSDICNRNEATRKKLKYNPDEAVYNCFNLTESVKKKNNSDEADSDVLKAIEIIDKKLKKTNPNEAVVDGQTPIKTLKKKVRKNNSDQINSYAVLKKIKRNYLDGTQISNSAAVKTQLNISKNPAEHTVNSNSHSSKKSQESEDTPAYLQKLKLGHHLVKKKEGKLKKTNRDRNTSSGQSDSPSLKKTCSKKLTNNTEASLIPENQNVISLPSNNRVQICIGNNRIKINIRSEGDKCKNEGALNSPSKCKSEKIIEAVVYSSPSKSKNEKTVQTIVYGRRKSNEIENKPENCSNEEHSLNVYEQISSPRSSQKGTREQLISLPTENFSFKTASGKTIEISEQHLKKATRMYDSTLLETSNLKQSHTKNGKELTELEGITSHEFKCTENIRTEANLKKCNETENSDKKDFEFKIPSRISDYEKTKMNQNVGFATASGKSIQISESVLNNMAKMFEEACFYKREFRDTFQSRNLFTSSCKEKSVQDTTTKKPQSNFTDKLTLAKPTPNSSQNDLPKNSTQNLELQSIPNPSYLDLIPLQRRILKPKSLLKPRPECGRPSYLQGGSRKSLNFHDPTKYPSCGDAGMNIIEFGNFQTTGFTLLSGKNLEIPKEKLEKAMNIFINIEKDVSGFISANKEKENVAHNNNQDCGFSLSSGNKEKFEVSGCSGYVQNKLTKKFDFSSTTGSIVDVSKEMTFFYNSGNDEKQTELTQEFGFSVAAGKSIDVPKIKSDEIFSDHSGKDKQTEFAGRSAEVPNTKPDEVPGDLVTPDGKQQTGKNVEISKKQLETRVKFFGDEKNAMESEGFGFSLASGKNIDIPKDHLKKAMEFFSADLNLKEEFSGKKHSGFALTSGKNLSISKEKITDNFKDIDRNLEELEKEEFQKGFTLATIQDSNNKNKNLVQQKQFASASDKNENLQHKKGSSLESGENENNKNKKGLSPVPGENEKLHYAKGVSFVTRENKNLVFKGFSCASGKNIEISKDKIEEAMHMFNTVQDAKNEKTINQNRSIPEMLQDAVSAYTSAIEKCESPKSRYNTPERNPQVKKQLGMLGPKKTIDISKESLERGVKIFKDLDLNLSSPGRNISQCSTPNLKAKSAGNFQVLETFNLTPIKAPKLMGKLEPNYKDSTIIFHEKCSSDFKELQSDIDSEYENLKKKLAVLERRKNELAQQKDLIDCSTGDYRRPKVGVLLESKSKSEERVPLKNLFNSGDESVDYFHVPQHIFDITSKNAEDVHFNLASGNDCVSVVKTSEEAVIIPSSGNMVGVTEISNAFHAMKGVDPKLLPNGWVHNHYKWIVWKLASYERKFPQYFKDCLSLENIIQQLKYRYDIEIDRAKRPALRRIYEKDDVPQKRMVLCISDIIQLYSNKFDLELTDGWYSIRTVIDIPLCQQIYRNKVKVGTKLIIQGAELLNCEKGNHPLEASDDVRLKINYNGTRRAHWYTKLGYYKYASPFPVLMSSLSSEGGPVGLIKIYIARVYPVRYIENHSNAKIWRNGKAEEKRQNEFDAERAKQIETIKDKACQEYKKEKRSTPYKTEDKNITKTELSTINCPKRLYNLIQCSGDPESLIELLTQSQQRSVMEYKQNLNAQRQHEISMKVSKQIEELKLSSRNVTPVLKLVVMDACEDVNKFYVLNVWRPSEEYLQMLKEDTSFVVYNVTFGKMGELHSSNRTYFRQNNEAVKLKKPERQILPINMTVDNYYKPIFDEFDTVGLIVQMDIQEHRQELWVTDFNGRLLYITIMNGPAICFLLNNLKRGQSVAISNLIKKIAKHDFGISIANQCSVISQYPSQQYLQKGLKTFNSQLPKNLDKLLTDCDAKIEHYKKEVKFMNLSFVRNSSFMMEDKSTVSDAGEDSVENNSTIPSQLTMTDVAMSLIDIEQFT